jgi:hypothetical protein
MWAYRLDHNYLFEGLTFSMRSLEAKHVITKHGSDVKAGLALFHHIGWDGTIKGEPQCYPVPGLHSVGLGIMLREVTGRTFIASPIPLPNIEKGLEWDAYTSDLEIGHTRQMVVHGEEAPKLKPAMLHAGWQLTANDNQRGIINGVNVTVFWARDRWKAILNPIGRRAIVTRGFLTAQECCDYVLTHFYDIIDPPDEFGGPVSDEELDGW